MANYDFESKYWWNGMEVVAGLDEAGRGSIAGPLVVGIVVFPPFYNNTKFNDSKSLTDKQRRKLLEEIKKDAIYYAYEVLSVDEVDHYNIYAATQLGMERAIKRMPNKAEAILTDAMPLKNIKDVPLEAIIKGDLKSCSIAAASIVAKVTRDDMMIELDKKYPGYGLASNKGYCTFKHVKALEEKGILEIHRKTYDPIKSMINEDKQMSIDEFIDEN